MSSMNNSSVAASRRNEVSRDERSDGGLIETPPSMLNSGRRGDRAVRSSDHSQSIGPPQTSDVRFGVSTVASLVLLWLLRSPSRIEAELLP
jgi:hypothetical protein